MKAQKIRTRPSLWTIEEAVAAHFDVNWSELRGKGRHPRVVSARRAFVFLARERTLASFPEIARHLHRKNHSQVLAQHRDAADLVDSDDAFAISVETCRKNLEAAHA